MTYYQRKKWILPFVLVLVVAVVVSVYVFTDPSMSPEPVSPAMKETPIVSGNEEPGAEEEEEEKEVVCIDGWALYLADHVPVSFCAPSRYGQAAESVLNNQTHITFAEEGAPDILFVPGELNGQEDSDAQELVSFECLEKSTDETKMSACFNPSHRVTSVERYVLINGSSAYYAKLEFQTQEGEERYRALEFVLLPQVANTSYHAEIAVPPGLEQEVREIANSFIQKAP